MDGISGLFDPKEGVLRRAEEEVRGDVEQLEAVRQRLYRERKGSDHLLRLIDTIKKRDLIDFLSSRNVIPKYGFPVDVVELQLLHHGEDAKRLKTSLERLEQCECGGPEGDASCYGCLRHYRNQFCHDLLRRGPVITFLRDVLCLYS